MPLTRPVPLPTQLIALAIALGMMALLVMARPTAAAPAGECTITVEPSTVAVGDQFVVSGDFGANAEIHLVRGDSTSFPEDSEPVATVPLDESSFSVSFTAQAGDEGQWTVWAFIFGTECGDSAPLTITASSPTPSPTPAAPAPVLPDTAVEEPVSTPVQASLLLALGIALALSRLVLLRRQV
jgi:hypothetical protein